MNWRFFIDFCLKKRIFQCSYSLANFWATCRYQEDFFIENQTYGQFLAYRSNRNFYYSSRLHVKHSFFANSPPDKSFTDFFSYFHPINRNSVRCRHISCSQPNHAFEKAFWKRTFFQGKQCGFKIYPHICW